MAFTPTIDDFNNVEGAQSPQQSSAPQTGGFTPTLASYNAVELQNAAPQAQQQPAANQNSLLQRLADPTQHPLQDTENNFWQGVGHAITGFGVGIPNTFLRTNIPNPISKPVGVAGSLGDVAGNIGTFITGGEALDAARAGVAGMAGVDAASPMALGSGGSGVSGWAANTARKAAGAGAFGIIDSNDNKASQGVKGAAISAGLDLLPPIAKGIGAGAQALDPSALTAKLLNVIGGGKTIEESGKDAAQDIQSAYKQNVADSGSNFNIVKQQVGNMPLFSKSTTYKAGGVTPEGLPADISSSQTPQINYQSVYPGAMGSYSPEAKQLHQQFLDNPTFNNAHDLQSQLGKDLGAASFSNKLNPSPATRQEMSDLKTSRDALKGDMNNFLNTQSPTLANTWNQGISSWEQNVVPYYANKGIAAIAKGNNTNPRSLANLVRNPSPEMQKVASDLSPETLDQIMYDKLGRQSVSKNPYTLLNTFDAAKNEGWGSFVTPNLNNQMEALRTKLSQSGLATHAAGALAGLATHGPLGGIVGGMLSPKMVAGMTSIAPVRAAGSFLSRSLQSIYPELATAIRANTPGGQ